MSYTICQPELDSGRDAILALWERNLPATTPGRYDWLYGQGPATAWLLHSDPGHVVGAAGLMGRRIRTGAGVLRAAQAIDLNVDRDHRTIGPALRLQRGVTSAVADGQLDLIYAFPNNESELVQRRVGYRVLGGFGRWAKPLECEQGIRGWLRYPRLRKAASAGLDLLLRLRSPETFYRRPAGVRVEVTDGFDARFDDLWQAAAPQFGLAGERSSDYLEWRFARSPSARHRVLCLVGAGGELLAYLVYSQRGRTAYVSDFLFRGEGHFDALLAEFLRLMRRQMAEAVITVYLGAEAVSRKLARFGFLKRPSAWKTLVYFDPHNPSLDAARVLDPRSWFLTRADVDTDF